MIDPTNITDFNCNINKLQEHILFWIFAAGKNGVTAAKCLNKILDQLGNHKPIFINLEFWYDFKGIEWLQNLLKSNGVGCFRNKSRTIIELIKANFDLQICSCDELESIFGIGRKTSRGFILHTRSNSNCAVLDRHVLHYMRDLGYEAPLHTPNSKKEYERLEKVFLTLVPKGVSVSKFDLSIWRLYSEH